MFPRALQEIINQLSKLPDIGPRAASRLVFYLLNQEQPVIDELAQSLKNIKSEVNFCQQCFNLTDKDSSLCPICRDKKRDQQTICLVENVLTIPVMERTKQYNGLYHVLGGLISPTNNQGPEKLRIKELVARAKQSREIIFALSPTTEGDTTTLYIERLLKPLNIKISRLGRGLSTGSDLEYIDENTLSSALRGRR